MTTGWTIGYLHFNARYAGIELQFVTAILRFFVGLGGMQSPHCGSSLGLRMLEINWRRIGSSVPKTVVHAQLIEPDPQSSLFL